MESGLLIGAPPPGACRWIESQPRGLAVGPELSPGTDVFVNVRIHRRLREMLDVMF